MALFDVITGLLGGLAAAASSNKNNNSNKTGSTGNTGSSTGAGSSGRGSAGTPYDAYGDLGEKILNATTDAEKQAYATLRQQKEDYMKAAGTWDPSWKTTSEFYTAPQQKLPQMPNLDLSAYLESQNYLNQMQAQNQQYLNSMKQTQKQNANASYDELSRQAYIQKLQNEKNAPKYMAMTGQTGGLSETTAIAPTVAYGNTLSDIGTSRAQTLSQIDLASDEQALQIAMAYADKAIAQANADRNLSYSAYRDQMGDYQYNQGFQYQAGRDEIADNRYDSEWAYQTAQKEKQEAYNRAMDLIANGILPSDDVLTAAGISKADAQALVNKANTAKPTGSGSKPKPYGLSSYAEMLLGKAQTDENFDLEAALDTALAQGLITQQDRNAALIYNGGFDGTVPTENGYNTYYTDDEFYNTKAILHRDFKNATPDEKAEYIAHRLETGKITAAQAQQLAKEFGVSL